MLVYNGRIWDACIACWVVLSEYYNIIKTPEDSRQGQWSSQGDIWIISIVAIIHIRYPNNNNICRYYYDLWEIEVLVIFDTLDDDQTTAIILNDNTSCPIRRCSWRNFLWRADEIFLYLQGLRH